MLSSLLKISRVSAMLEPEVGAGPGSATLSSLFIIKRRAVMLDPPGPLGALWLCVRGGPVFRRLAGVGADFGLGLCCGFGCTLRSSLGFGCCCSCWRFSGPPSCGVSTCCEASSPPPSILSVSSLSLSLASCPGATPFMTFTIIFVMPAPHTLSSSWRASHFCCLSCIHVLIPPHCASLWAACAYTRFVRCPTVRCTCVSSCASCRIVLSMRLRQSLGVTGASLLLHRFPFLSHSIGSNMVAPAVSVGVGVAAVVISIAMSTGASLLLSPASPWSRSLLSLTLASVITPRKQTSLSRVVLVVACWLADALRNHVFCEDSMRLHSIVWVRVRAILLQSDRCWEARSGVNSMSRIDCRCPLCSCYRCCRLIALFLFRQDFFIVLTLDLRWKVMETFSKCRELTLIPSHNFVSHAIIRKFSSKIASQVVGYFA